MADEILTQDYLQSIFDYKDGELFWKIKPNKPISIGTKAGCLDTNNYYRVRIKGKMYGLHRIIFLMHYGYLPLIIDHIDGNPKNNVLSNLREATVAENAWNSKLHKKNTSNYKNVIFRKDRNKWTCRIRINGKDIMRGAFNSPEEANDYATNLRNEFHKQFFKS
jgi:hypothetical protein